MLGYLLTSRSITLYVLYTLHVMLGSTLIFAGLFTYGVHTSKAMARANAKQANDLDIDIAVEGNSTAYASHNGEFAGLRRVKSMVGLRRDDWNGTAAAAERGEEEVVKFREVCYGVKERETVEIEMEVPGLGKGGRAMPLEMS
jgi:hypothetical protein